MAFVSKRLNPRVLPVYVLAAGLVWVARPSVGSLLVGAVPLLAGLGLRIWATGHLVKNDDLTISGPYAFVRHPLYLGTLLCATGLAIMAASPLAWGVFALFAVGYFAYYVPYKNRIEGGRLEELYGDPFRRYAVAVPVLVPRVFPYRPLAGDRAGTATWSAERVRENNEVGTTVVGLLGLAAMWVRWALI